MQSGKSLLNQYITFAEATVASLLVYSLYSIVDGLFVSHGVSEYAMSAVNIALPYTNLLFTFALLFGVGASVITAVYLAEGREREASCLFTQNTVVLLVLGASLTALVFLFLDPLASLLGADEATFDYVRDYLRGIAPFSACFIVSYNMEILIKTDGRPKKALWTVVAGCLFNCAGDYLALFVFDMGVYGAALATGLSQLFVCCIYFHHFIKCDTRFRFTRFSFDLSVYRRLLPLGAADAATEICNGVMIFLYNRTLLRCIGADGIVSYAVIAYVNTLTINIVSGASAAAQPLVSFQHGKKDESACRRLFRYSLVTAGMIEALVLAAIFFCGKSIVRAFIGEGSESLCAASLRALHIYGASVLFIGMNIVIGGYMTAREKPTGAMVISFGRGFVVQAAALLLLSVTLGGTSVWFAPVISEAVCFLIALALYRSFRTQNERL